jgi:hypothetical protein
MATKFPTRISASYPSCSSLPVLKPCVNRRIAESRFTLTAWRSSINTKFFQNAASQPWFHLQPIQSQAQQMCEQSGIILLVTL